MTIWKCASDALFFPRNFFVVFCKRRNEEFENRKESQSCHFWCLVVEFQTTQFIHRFTYFYDNFFFICRMNTSGTLRCKPLGLCLIFISFLLLYLAVFRNSSSPEPSSIKSSPDRAHISLHKLLAVAIDAAVSGGNEVRIVRQLADMDEKSKGKTKEGVNDPVTAGDMRSHRAMFSALTATFPGLRVISEEHDVDDYGRTTPSFGHEYLASISSVIPKDEELLTSDLTVWIDPLDATKEYTGIHFLISLPC